MQVILNDDQLLDLIFEKKITYGNIQISGTHSFLGILSKLDERLSRGKILGCKNSVFCGPAGSESKPARIHFAKWERKPRGREKVHDCIGSV